MKRVDPWAVLQRKQDRAGSTADPGSHPTIWDLYPPSFSWLYERASYFKAAIYYIHMNPNFPKDIHSHQALLYKYTLHIKSRLPALRKPLSQQALKSYASSTYLTSLHI